MEPIESSITDPVIQQDRATEAKILRAVAKAGAFCIGFTAEMVLFQEPSTTLAIPLAEFANPERAVALIKQKIADAGYTI
jgi:hypothetical protein